VQWTAVISISNLRQITPTVTSTGSCLTPSNCRPSLITGGKFLDVFVGFPGSVHDARMLRNSPVYAGSFYPPAGKAILGDGGYQGGKLAPATSQWRVLFQSGG